MLRFCYDRKCIKAIYSNTYQIVMILFLNACVTTKMQFKANGVAQVSAVVPGKLANELSKLGLTPLTTPLTANPSEIFLVTQAKMAPTYLIMSQSKQNELTIKLEDLDQSPVVRQNSAKPIEAMNPNKVFRVITQAYRAINARQYELALELSEQASTLDPSLAAPFLLKGMAMISLGKDQLARAAFLQAQALDPQDSEINRMMRDIFVQ